MKVDKIYQKWIEAIKNEQACALATILHQASEAQYRAERLLVCQSGEMYSSLSMFHIEKQLVEKLCDKLQCENPNSETIDIPLSHGETLSVFIDIHNPPLEVLIFGAGHDAKPVANFSQALGYKTVVIDARPGFNNADNFPNAERKVIHPNRFMEEVKITSRTYAIIMNHHIEKDRDTLAFLLQKNAAYIGLLGPKSRREKLLNQLTDEGKSFHESQLEKLHNPIGLDIGADSPEEIAISIFAEIIAKQKGHQGGFLHNKTKIHKNSNLEGILP